MVDRARYVLFVSSTSDMPEYRSAARESILRFESHPIMMEHFPSGPRRSTEVVEGYLLLSDAVLVIAGAFYGSDVDDEKTRSFVEWEFDRAVSLRIPVVSFVLSDRARQDARDRAAPGDPASWKRQEEFIAKLRRQASNSFEDVATFGSQLSGALHSFRDSLGEDAGLTSKVSTAKLQRRVLHLERISSFAVVQQAYEGLSIRKDSAMEKGVGDSRELSQQIIDLLHNEVLTEPATTAMVARLMSHLIERLDGFSSTEGFAAESLDELRLVIQGLFGETLQTLKATSIHSQMTKLAAYKGYWEDPELGDFFKKQNAEYLNRSDVGKHEILRVFACDSLPHSVAEPWFTGAVIPQVDARALVKIAEIDASRIDEYEDFGIYEHAGRGVDTAYLLLAPPESNRAARELRTTVTANSRRVEAYRAKFERMWSASDEPLHLVKSDKLESARRRKAQTYDLATINELFENCVVLRNMVRLDNDAVLIPEAAGFVRKYEQSYAEAVRDHLKKYFRKATSFFYVGDTYKNDGTLVRNLQQLGCDIKGFICEPSLNIDALWFSDILYTTAWTDLVEFADRVHSDIGSRSVALFDIDQTLWSPKGTELEEPLRRTRTAAMLALVGEFYRDPDGAAARRARKRIDSVYKKVSDLSFQESLTLDNEDYKAAICVLLSLNLVWEPDALRRKGPEYFRELDDMTPSDFADHVDQYLRRLVGGERNGLANFTVFLGQTSTTADTDHFNSFASDDIKVDELRLGIQTMFQRVFSTEKVKYPDFRYREHEEALARVGELRDLADSMVINKPAWDLATWFAQNGVPLLAISDRPDESTLGSGDNRLTERSLLNARMRVWGRSISDLLPQVR